MDPTQLIVQPVVSGATAAFVEQALSASTQWLRDRFAHHREAAQAQATANRNAYLDELAQRVQRLEVESDFLREQIAAAMSRPDFSVLMEHAVFAAAQTDNREKQVVLATIVSERLRVESDTLVALTSQMAADAAAHLAPKHLHILGFTYTVRQRRFPQFDPPVAPELHRRMELEWVALMLKPYEDLAFTRLDLQHLDSVRCLGARYGFFSASLDDELKSTTSPDFDYGRFVMTEIGARFQALYEATGLGGTTLTSTGSLIGMYVADQLANRPTDVTHWEVDTLP
jgi:hypothetical protein